jgi:hypothetical protein
MFKLSPKPTVTVSIETSGPDVAATLEQAAVKALELAKAFCIKEIADGPPDHKARAARLLPALPLLKPQVEGARLTLTLGDDENELAMLRQQFAPIVAESRQHAQRAQRMNQFKQIALGMLNHESAKKSYPASASYSADGKPLLSWRVHILPYVEEAALYKQFHLDEPWDSPHNRQLVEKMPNIYADPDPAVRQAVKDAGRTTFVVPVGDGLLFGGREGMSIRDVTDGTSATILAVEVVPEKAVIWTQPEDWEVDLNDPLAGVKRSDRNGFAAAYCDGHVEFHRNDVEQADFKALLTPAGDE